MTILKAEKTNLEEILASLKNGEVKVDGLLNSVIFDNPVEGVYTYYNLPYFECKKLIGKENIEEILQDLKY